MMVVCQSHSCRLFVNGKWLYYATAKEKREAKAFYESHGFPVGKPQRAKNH